MANTERRLIIHPLRITFTAIDIIEQTDVILNVFDKFAILTERHTKRQLYAKLTEDEQRDPSFCGLWIMDRYKFCCVNLIYPSGTTMLLQYMMHKEYRYVYEQYRYV